MGSSFTKADHPWCCAISRLLVVAVVGGILATSPSIGTGQQAGRLPVLAMLLTGSSSAGRQLPEVDAFMRELTELGWLEGRKLTVERRWTENADSFTALAADLIRVNPSVFLTLGAAATRAAKGVTSKIPIVMVAFSDPQHVGAAGLARPGAISPG